jgi:uncharacterized protein (TIGR02145 family)
LQTQNLSWILYGGLEVKVGAKAEILGKTLFDYDKNIIQDSIILAQGSQPVQDTTTHQDTLIMNIPCPGTPTATDIDGNVYNTVKIGDQCWLKENLKTTHYANGDAIPNVTDNTQWINLTTGAYCNYCNNATIAETYGHLYNLYAVADTRNICPVGWKIPSVGGEWEVLTNYLGGKDIAGGKLKEAGTAHWTSPNAGATNESGFTALPGGSRNCGTGFFNNLNSYGFWYASYFDYVLWERMDYNIRVAQWNMSLQQSSKKEGMSVRCIKI